MKQCGYCFLCLKEDHKIHDCKKKRGCFCCKVLYIFAVYSERDKKDDKNKEVSPSRTTNSTITCHMENQLQTAAVILENSNTKKRVKVKVLLDTGSEKTYLSERIRKFLNLSTEAVDDVNISISGNFQTTSKSINRVLLAAKTNNLEKILINALYLPTLFAYIKSKYHISKEKFHGTELVDEDTEKDINLLIGSDLHWRFVTGNIVNSEKSGGLVAVVTTFGWNLSHCVGVFEYCN